MIRCTNSNRGTFNHECGRPASHAGTHAGGDVQHFCTRCRRDGDEARTVVAWRDLPSPATEPPVLLTPDDGDPHLIPFAEIQAGGAVAVSYLREG